jgi:DNA helicase INO80
MGLGKTIQAIALMCHLSENKNNFGPFLIIAPTVTLFNWFNEIEKFSTELKSLAYWGSLKERKIV